MKIIIAGGTGQVGTILARHFHRNGQSVVVLSRSLQKVPWRVVHWDGSTLGPWLDELNHSDVLINLAGRSVNCRYTRKNRREIIDSRVLSTQILHQAIAAIEHPPAVWFNASTATIYRHALDRPMDESTGEFGGVLKSIFGLAVPVQVERAVWVIALILILIGALTLLAGGGRLNFG